MSKATGSLARDSGVKVLAIAASFALALFAAGAIHAQTYNTSSSSSNMSNASSSSGNGTSSSTSNNSSSGAYYDPSTGAYYNGSAPQQVGIPSTGAGGLAAEYLSLLAASIALAFYGHKALKDQS